MNGFVAKEDIFSQTGQELFECDQCQRPVLWTIRCVASRTLASGSYLFDCAGRCGNLYRSLVKLRIELAEASDCMPYMVASNKALLDISQIRPTDPSYFFLVDGFSEAKISKFGNRFIEHIKEFCTQNNMAMNVIDDVREDSQNNECIMKLLGRVSETVRTTYNLFAEGKSPEDSAIIRNLAVTTIYSHLGEAYKAGLPVDLSRTTVTPQVLHTVLNIVRSPPINSDISSLAAIKNNCPDTITWGMLHLAICVIRKRISDALGESPEGNIQPVQSISSETCKSGFKSSLSAVQAQPTLDRFTYQPKTCCSSSTTSSASSWLSKDTHQKSALPQWLMKNNASASTGESCTLKNSQVLSDGKISTTRVDEAGTEDQSQLSASQLNYLLEGLGEIMSNDDPGFEDFEESKQNTSMHAAFQEGHSSDEELAQLDIDEFAHGTIDNKDNNRTILVEKDEGKLAEITVKKEEEFTANFEESVTINPEDFNDNNDWSTEKFGAKFKSDEGNTKEVSCTSDDSGTNSRAGHAEATKSTTTPKRLPSWLVKPESVKKKMKKSSLFC